MLEQNHDNRLLVLNPESHAFTEAARNVKDWDKEKEKKLIINRLEKLIKYFKKCPFFENPESRSSALDTLEKTRIDWGNKQELIDRGNQKIY